MGSTTTAGVLSRVPRWWQLAAVLAVATPLGVLAFRAVMLSWGSSASAASLFAGAAAASFVLGAVLFARLHWSGWFPPRLARRVVALVWAGMPALAAAALAYGVLDLSAVPVVAVGATVFAVAFLRYRRMVDAYTPLQMRRPTKVRTLRGAEKLVDACREQLRDTRMPPAQRAVVEVNLASGLAQRSALAANREGLDEAAAILARVVQQPGLDPWILVLVVTELVSAKDVLAARHGDDDFRGYEEVLRLQQDVVRALPPGRRETATAVARTGQDQAHYYVYRATLVSSVDAEEFRRQRGKAVAALRKGIRIAPPGSELVAEMWIMLGSTLAMAGAGSDEELEEGIRHVREGLRRVGPLTRDFGRLQLALLLVERAERGAATAPADLDEAEALSRPVAAGRSDLRGEGSRLLARIEAARREGWR